MKFKDKQQNLFNNTSDYAYTDCISADLGIGVGIAVEFNKRFDIRNKLKKGIRMVGLMIMEMDTEVSFCKIMCLAL